MRQWKMWLLAALTALAVAACGQDDVPESGDVSSTAEQLAQETRDLQRDVRETARRLIDAEDPGDVQDRVRKLERNARELAERVQDELPDSDLMREALARANRRTADAARDLRRSAEAHDEEMLAAARRSLDDARERLDSVIQELPPDVRRQLEHEVDEPGAG